MWVHMRSRTLNTEGYYTGPPYLEKQEMPGGGGRRARPGLDTAWGRQGAAHGWEHRKAGDLAAWDVAHAVIAEDGVEGAGLEGQRLRGVDHLPPGGAARQLSLR